MEYLNNNVLCLEYNDFVPKIMIKSTYDLNKYRGNIVVHGYGGNGRRILIEYETLPSKYKAKVREKYGDPYQYASRQPILKSILPNLEARQYYDSYVLPNGDNLPNEDVDLKGNAQINYVNRYTRNAEWLDMLIRLTTDKRALKRELNVTLEDFWKSCGVLIKMDEYSSLPTSAKRINQNIKKYKAEGYDALIDLSKWANDRSRKVNEEKLKSFLKLRNRIDCVDVAIEYNKWAKEKFMQTITPAAVKHWAKKWEYYLKMYREGSQAAKSTLKKEIKGKRPSAPLLRIEGDDNDHDLYWKRPEMTKIRAGKEVVLEKTPWGRISLYIVIDTFNDMIIGWAAGHTITNEVVMNAFRDAAMYIYRKTGDYYGWQQMQTDRWHLDKNQTTELGQFYKSITKGEKSIPAQLHNPNSKYIERTFGSVWHKQMKKYFPKNYAGHNVKSKQSLSPDTLKTKEFPPIEEAPRMITEFIQSVRNTKRTGCDLSREHEWIAAFRASNKSKKYLMTPALWLNSFGVKHLPKNGMLPRISKKGLLFEIDKTPYQYELSQAQMLKHIGKKVNVTYDPTDMSKVLISDGEGMRFVAHEFDAVPRALADYEDGDGARIQSLIEEGKTLIPMIQEWAGDPDGLLLAEAENQLRSGVQTKEIGDSG